MSSQFAKCLGISQTAWKIRRFANCLGVLQNDGFLKMPATFIYQKSVLITLLLSESGQAPLFGMISPTWHVLCPCRRMYISEMGTVSQVAGPPPARLKCINEIPPRDTDAGRLRRLDITAIHLLRETHWRNQCPGWEWAPAGRIWSVYCRRKSRPMG